ncbi:hypothetical protein QQ045_005871 [Rhodiola kirilowii]
MGDVQASFQPPGISDHCPVIVSWGQEVKKNKSFRYCNFWENLEDYEEAISSSWINGLKSKDLFVFQAKLKNMKNMMKQKFVGRTRGMDKRVNLAREALLEAQNKSASNPFDLGSSEEERRMASEFRKLKFNQ